MTLSSQVLNAPITGFQIELILNSLEVYRASGNDSKDVEYLEQQLVLYRNMLIEQYRRDSSSTSSPTFVGVES